MKWYTPLFLVGATLLMSTASTHANTSICNIASGLADAGIVSSKSSCQDYSLDRSVLRQEVAAIAQKVSTSCGTKISASSRCQNIFSDVSSSVPNTWVCSSVEALANTGVVTVTTATHNTKPYFRPEALITHAEVLAILIGSAGYEAGQGYTSTTWQVRVAMHARELGIISSLPSVDELNSFATRGDVFIYAAGLLVNSCDASIQTSTATQSSDVYIGYTDTSLASCSPGSYASGGLCYSCASTPTNASYVQLNSCSWSCDSGYYRSGDRCIRNTIQCGVGYEYTNGTCNTCTDAPGNSRYTDSNSCEWSCDSGYYKYGNQCVPEDGYYVGNSVCGIGYLQIGSACQTCQGKPTNSVYSASGSCSWSCDAGYFEKNGKCYEEYLGNNCSTGEYSSEYGCTNCKNRPDNAVYTGTGHSCNWRCETGYTEKNGKCYRTGSNEGQSCGIGYFPINSGACNICTNAPENSFYFSEDTCKWRCESGFYELNGRCYSDPDSGVYQGYTNTTTNNNSCSTGSYYSNGHCYSCSSTLPINAYYSGTSSCSWSCLSGYYRSGGLCVR